MSPFLKISEVSFFIQLISLYSIIPVSFLSVSISIENLLIFFTIAKSQLKTFSSLKFF